MGGLPSALTRRLGRQDGWKVRLVVRCHALNEPPKFLVQPVRKTLRHAEHARPQRQNNLAVGALWHATTVIVDAALLGNVGALWKHFDRVSARGGCRTGKSQDVQSDSAVVAGELGFEPRQTESESVVLPLHHSPMNYRTGSIA